MAQSAMKRVERPMTKRKHKAGLPARRVVGTAVAIRQEGNTPASATATMVALAQSKDFDAVKFQALAQFQRDMVVEQARLNFFEDLHTVQRLMPSISRDGKITIKAKGTDTVIQTTPYATFPNIMKTVSPILREHHFTLNFIIGSEPDGRPIVTGVLASTRGGHFQTSSMTLKLDTTGSKNDVQGAGSAVAYAKRYITIGLLNIISHAVEDKDDDGVIAGDAGVAPIDDAQFKELDAKLTSTGADRVKFRTHFGIESIRELPVKRFKEAMTMLNEKAERAKS